MNILHLTIGIPPYRTGGLTNYAYSIAKAEIEMGHSVSILYPGNITIIGNKSRIEHVSNNSLINIYKIVNPNYVAIPLGIKNPKAIIKKGPRKIYRDFLEQIHPDLIHVHTFMGFHKELFFEIKGFSIPCLYTTHDYYPICPRTSLVMNTNELCSGYNPKKCCNCNYSAEYSMILQYMLQSEWYYMIKKSRLFVWLKKNRQYFFRPKTKKTNYPVKRKISSKITNNQIVYYKKLWNYQMEMFSAVSIIHCNSTITEKVYKPFYNNKSHFVLGITSDGIIDNRITRHSLHFKQSGTINIGYIGIKDFHKGEWLLEKAGKILYDEGYKFKILLYGDEYNSINVPFCENRGVFSHENIGKIMKEIDLMVVPGYWYETFGFATMEAICNSVPVIVSSHTGSKDLLVNMKTPRIFNPDEISLASILRVYLNDTDLLIYAQKEQKDILLTTDVKEHASKLIKEVSSVL